MAEADDDDLAPRLRRYRAADLTERISFRVDNEPESNPYEAGPCVVTADSRKIEIWFDGDSKHRWSGTWTDLRWLLGRIENERKAEAAEIAAREKVKQQMAARAQKVADDAAKKRALEWNGMLKRRKTRPRPDDQEPAPR